MGLTNRCSAVASAWARLSVVLGVVMGVGGVDRGFSERRYEKQGEARRCGGRARARAFHGHRGPSWSPGRSSMSAVAAWVAAAVAGAAAARWVA